MIIDVLREMLVGTLKKLDDGSKLNISSLNCTSEQLSEILFIRCQNSSVKMLAPELIPLLSKIDFSGTEVLNCENLCLSKAMVTSFGFQPNSIIEQINNDSQKTYKKTISTFNNN